MTNKKVNNIVKNILSEIDSNDSYGLYNFEYTENGTAGEIGRLVHTSYNAFILIYDSVFYVHGNEAKHLPINNTTLGYIDKIRKLKM